MNTNLDYKKIENESVEKWSHHLDVDKIKSKHIVNTISTLIENQTIWWNSAKDNHPLATHIFEDIPYMVKKIFDPEEFLGFDLVSVQAMLNPVQNIYRNTIVQHKEKFELTAKTRNLKTKAWELHQDLRGRDIEEDRIFVINPALREISLELNREIYTDLYNNAGTLAKNIKKDQIPTAMREIEAAMSVKVNEWPNWIMCSNHTAASFFKDSFFSPDKVIHKTQWKNYKLFTDPFFPRNTILMGYKGEDKYDSPYTYCPYMPISCTPVVLDPNSFIPTVRLTCRYGKALQKTHGCKYYGKITYLDK
jgi:hypothetical protein